MFSTDLRKAVVYNNILVSLTNTYFHEISRTLPVLGAFVKKSIPSSSQQPRTEAQSLLKRVLTRLQSWHSRVVKLFLVSLLVIENLSSKIGNIYRSSFFTFNSNNNEACNTGLSTFTKAYFVS